MECSVVQQLSLNFVLPFVFRPRLQQLPRLLKSQLVSKQLSLLYSSEDSSLTILFCPQCAGSGPTPLSLQRLASCLQSVVSLLECPVCLETIPPPAFQCCNGHTLCSGCRSLTDRCPVCRVALGPRGRCLLADKLHALFSTTFLQPVSRKQKRSKVITNYYGLFQGYVNCTYCSIYFALIKG